MDAFSERASVKVFNPTKIYECVGANCTEFIYPVVNYHQPDAKRTADYDRFDIEGLPTPPEMTHIHL